MGMQINPQEIIEKLNKLQEDINFIKCNMIDPDCILDEEDIEALKNTREEYKNGETISHEELIKELRI
jgi:hypothetical protein